MDNSLEPAIRIAALEATIARLRQENASLRSDKTVLESLAVIDEARMKRLQRQLAEATHGMAARASGPSGSRSTDKQ